MRSVPAAPFCSVALRLRFDHGCGILTPRLFRSHGQGDIWDKGGADLYVLRQLLSLRRRAGPDRVHFLMGNRDINKMRIVDECGVGNIRDQDEALPLHEGVYWRAGLEHSIPPDESAAERVKWMLGKTMGSVDAFELRRNELERERAAVADGTAVSSARRTGMPSTGVSVTDAEVAQSYIRSCDPANGIMGQCEPLATRCCGLPLY